MPYLSVPAGTQSKLIEFPVYDSSSSVGALKSGLLYSNVTAFFDLWGASGSANSIALATMTKGSWATGGFIAVDGVNMPGIYQLGIPNAALTGAQGVTIQITGTGIVPVIISIELTATSNQDGVHGGMSALPNAAAGASGGLPTVDANNGVKISSGTGANQLSLSSGAVLLQATQTGVTIPTVTNLTNAPTNGDFTAAMKTSLNNSTPASITGAVGSVAGAVGSVTGGVTVSTNNDKTGYALTAAEHTLISGTDVPNAMNATIPALPTAGSIFQYIQALKWGLLNKLAITDSNGNATGYKDDDATTAFNISGMFTDNATTTTRLRPL